MRCRECANESGEQHIPFTSHFPEWHQRDLVDSVYPIYYGHGGSVGTMRAQYSRHQFTTSRFPLMCCTMREVPPYISCCIARSQPGDFSAVSVCHMSRRNWSMIAVKCPIYKHIGEGRRKKECGSKSLASFFLGKEEARMGQ